MRSAAVVLTGLAALAVASPAAQGIDFAAVNANPTVDITGPDGAANTEILVFTPSATGAAAASSLATASATASVAPNSNQRRTFNFCLWGWFGFCPKTTSPTTSTTSAAAVATKTSIPSSSGQSTTAPPATITSAPLSSSTLTPTTTYPSWINTNSFTSQSGCPTPFEVGTYCGFINPEDPCVVQPDGYGPKVTPDTTAAFSAYPAFHSAAQNAKTPAGYAQTFQDLNAQVQGNTYLGLQTLRSYDVQGCADYCSNKTDVQCTGFNIFVERDPSINPSAEYGCADPSSMTNYKCTLWGSAVDNTTAIDQGQYRDGFHVVIAGSNGYTRANTTTPITPPGWGNPKHCGGAHNHPASCIGQHFFPGFFDPRLCASYAEAQNTLNLGAGWRSLVPGYSNKKCSFFNAYMLKKNGAYLGTYCSLFTQEFEPETGSWLPGWNSGSFWDVTTSWTYSCNK